MLPPEITQPLVPYFRPTFSREDAEAFLSPKKNRAFVIRLSTRGGFVVSYVKDGGAIMHHRILRDNSASFYAEGAQRTFSSLAELLVHSKFLTPDEAGLASSHHIPSPSNSSPTVTSTSSLPSLAHSTSSLPGVGVNGTPPSSSSLPHADAEALLSTDPLLAPFYLPNLTRADAEAHLRGKPVDSFLLRRAPTPSSFVLSFVESDRSLHHCLLHVEKGGCYIEGDQDRFPDVASLLRAYKFLGTRPVGAPPTSHASAYQGMPAQSSSLPSSTGELWTSADYGVIPPVGSSARATKLRHEYTSMPTAPIAAGGRNTAQPNVGRVSAEYGSMPTMSTLSAAASANALPKPATTTTYAAMPKAPGAAAAGSPVNYVGIGIANGAAPNYGGISVFTKGDTSTEAEGETYDRVPGRVRRPLASSNYVTNISALQEEKRRSEEAERGRTSSERSSGGLLQALAAPPERDPTMGNVRPGGAGYARVPSQQQQNYDSVPDLP